MARLVVISNRVALPRTGRRAGGLEVAVLAALRRNQGIWFGWSGRVSNDGLETRTTPGDRISYVTTDLNREDYNEYYYGFSNRVLWPILHYRLDLAQFARRELDGYLRVNERFANELSNVLLPDDLVWVHDYHLLPFAGALRALGHQNRIGFFLHTPFPPPEIISALPHHERIVAALCHYDLVAFQTETDAANFARYVEAECRLRRVGARRYATRHGQLRILALPVGIEVDSFSRMARRAARSSFVTGVLSSLVGRPMIIGVDRLDYSKGIDLRMDAFDQFLHDHPQWRHKVTYLQITPKSRSGIREYAEMERLITGKIGQTNGTYGEASWTPIRYVNRPHSRTALAGLYRAARAALVTPLRDGMNLVAKEFIAAQDPEDPGVLILSRFAGAAFECRPALLVNPYDADSVASTINLALSMPLAERRARQDELYRIISRNDIHTWAARFLDSLANSGGSATTLPYRASA